MEASIPESRRPDALEVGAWIHLRPLGAIPSRSAVFFQFRTQQPNRGSARDMHKVENFGNHLKLERTITLKKSNPMSTQSEEIFKMTAQFIVLYTRPIDPYRAIRSNLNNHSLRRVNGYRLAYLPRQARLKSHLLVRNDHKYDQEHEQNINQRDYIHIRYYTVSTTRKPDSHEPPHFR
jgi:hypothetical protein